MFKAGLLPPRCTRGRLTAFLAKTKCYWIALLFKTGLLRHFIPRKDRVLLGCFRRATFAAGLFHSSQDAPWPMMGGRMPPLRFVGIADIPQLNEAIQGAGFKPAPWIASPLRSSQRRGVIGLFSSFPATLGSRLKFFRKDMGRNRLLPPRKARADRSQADSARHQKPSELFLFQEGFFSSGFMAGGAVKRLVAVRPNEETPLELLSKGGFKIVKSL